MDEDEYTFQPEICPRSDRLVAARMEKYIQKRKEARAAQGDAAMEQTAHPTVESIQVGHSTSDAHSPERSRSRL